MQTDIKQKLLYLLPLMIKAYEARIEYDGLIPEAIRILVKRYYDLERLKKFSLALELEDDNLGVAYAYANGGICSFFDKLITKELETWSASYIYREFAKYVHYFTCDTKVLDNLMNNKPLWSYDIEGFQARIMFLESWLEHIKET